MLQAYNAIKRQPQDLLEEAKASGHHIEESKDHAIEEVKEMRPIADKSHKKRKPRSRPIDEADVLPCSDDPEVIASLIACPAAKFQVIDVDEDCPID
jgi:hypothetical protein